MEPNASPGPWATASTAASVQARVYEQDLRCILETATVGLVQSGPDQLIINANPAFCELTGYSLAALRGMRIADLTPPEEQLADAQAWARLTVGREDRVYRGKKHYVRRDGSVIPVSVRVSAVRDAHGLLRYAIGSVQDISESVRREEAERICAQAQAASRAKSAFVAQISHELRTPLNAILGFSQLLSRTEDLSDPQANAWLDQIQLAGWHLLAVINDLLDLTRIESGVLEIQPCRVGLESVLNASVAMVSDTANRRGVVIHNRVGRDAGAVHADPVRPRQVLINLLSNAVKYNRGGGEISVQWRRLDRNRIEVDVADTGLGMNEAQLDRLFRPFNRLGRERSGIEGTGIGLVIARGLIERMGGSLAVRSVAGHGSTFTLCLPAALAQDRPGADPDDQSVLRPPAAKRRVLCVDHDEAHLEIMQAMISRRPQIRVSTAASAAEALAALAQDIPDLVLLEHQLPDLDGLSLLRRIRATPAISHLPVVMVSANLTDAHATRTIASGANGLLSKPLHMSLVLAMLDKHLKLAGMGTGSSTLET